LRYALRAPAVIRHKIQLREGKVLHLALFILKIKLKLDFNNIKDYNTKQKGGGYEHGAAA
jgi:hypothetical protein